MTNIDDEPIFQRFEPPEQARLRETKLRAWWLDRILEDRGDCDLMPPLELLEPAAMANVTARMIAALPVVEPPPGWEKAPLIKEWSLVVDGTGLRIDGRIYGSKGRYLEGEPIRTSALRAIDGAWRFIVTKNNVYRVSKTPPPCTTH